MFLLYISLMYLLMCRRYETITNADGFGLYIALMYLLMYRSYEALNADGLDKTSRQNFNLKRS